MNTSPVPGSLVSAPTALLAYQRGHGLDDDAVAGAATGASLLTHDDGAA